MSIALALVVSLAGAVGACLRHLVAVLLPPRPERGLSWAVLTVNVAGSAVTGALLAAGERALISPEVLLVLATGFCGGLTTFSTFSVETVQRVRHGRTGAAALDVVANLAAGIGIALIAYLLVR
ncbi:hypothetical protein GCM10027416_32900 [Okibacterium endophyticum]